MCPADPNGNITSEKTYAYTRGELGTPESTVNYTYDSVLTDLLTSYKGQTVYYDTIGNPTSYRGMTMTWTQGRRLESLTKNGVTHSYTYDINGIRTSKTINGVTTSYILADGTLLGVMVPNQYRLIFLRDNNDTIYGFKYYKYVSSSATYNYNQTYYYEFNLQGDVIALYNASGNLYATYKYDAWGKLLGVYDNEGDAITSSTNLAIINPIRYRGYIYDTETGFYYLNSRYYDPEVGRFLNLDAYVNANGDFIGYNMYAYCSNNPVNCSDPTGERLERYEIDGIGGSTGNGLRQNADENSFFEGMLNKDGTHSIYDNDRFRDDGPFHEQLFVIDPSGPSFDPINGNVGLGSISGNLITGGWQWNNFDLSLLDFGHVELSAEMSDGNFSLGALASVWNPSASVTIWGVTIEVSFECGSIGGYLNYGTEGFKIGGSYGCGASLSIS